MNEILIDCYCPKCDMGTVNVGEGPNVIKLPCDFCKGTGNFRKVISIDRATEIIQDAIENGDDSIFYKVEESV